MNLNEIHLVVAEDARAVRVLYAGNDAAEALRTFETADGAPIVGITSFPAWTRIRHPVDEAARVKAQAEHARRSADVVERERAAKAAALRAKAVELNQQAAALAPEPVPAGKIPVTRKSSLA